MPFVQLAIFSSKNLLTDVFISFVHKKQIKNECGKDDVCLFVYGKCDKMWSCDLCFNGQRINKLFSVFLFHFQEGKSKEAEICQK